MPCALEYMVAFQILIYLSTQVNRLHYDVDSTVRAPPGVSMPLQAPTRDEAFTARIQHSATMGITAPGSECNDATTRAVEALEDDMLVYAELNALLGAEDLDEPAAGKGRACVCLCAHLLAKCTV